MADSVVRTLGGIIEGGAGTVDSMVRMLVDVREGEEGMADLIGVGEGSVVGFSGDELLGPFLLGGGEICQVRADYLAKLFIRLDVHAEP